MSRSRATPEERAAGNRIYGIVLLVGVFGMFIFTDVLLLAGAGAAIAIPAGAVFGILLGFNVKRVLERRHRREHPDG